MQPWTRGPTIRRRTAVLMVVLAGAVHVSYLTSLGLHVAAGLPGRSTRIDSLFRDAAFSLGPSLAGAMTISFKVLPVVAVYAGLLWRGIGAAGDPLALRAAT